jgi:DNA-directed RNA polymerase specialized sigma24 family protein
MDILDEYVNPIEVMVDSENFSHIKNRLYDRLTELEESVFRQYESGYSYKEIAKNLKVSDSKCVDNALMRIRKKAKSLWKELEEHS